MYKHIYINTFKVYTYIHNLHIIGIIIAHLKVRNAGVDNLLFLPQAVKNVTIREHSQHDIFCGGVMNKRSFRVDEEDVRNPDLLHQAPVKSHAFIRGAGERQALILPVVSQV